MLALLVVAGLATSAVAANAASAGYSRPSMYTAPCANGGQAVRPSSVSFYNCVSPINVRLTVTHIHWTTYRHGVAIGKGRMFGRWCLVKEFRPRYLSYGGGAAPPFTGWAFTRVVLHSPRIVGWQNPADLWLS